MALMLSAVAQELKVTLRPNAKPLEVTGYEIKEVIDLRIDKNKLGEVHTLGGQKAKVVSSKALDQSALGFFSAGTKLVSNSPQNIQVKIYELKLSENKASGKSIYEGNIQLVIGFYKKENSETVLLTDYTASAQYRRSLNRVDMIENVVNRVFLNSLNYFDAWMKIQVMENRDLARTVRLEIIDEAKTSHQDTVYYDPKRPLIWPDFKDRPERGSSFNASIFTSFSIQGKSIVESGEIVQRLEIDVYMLPEQSWVKNSSNYALNHEQRHFDVVRIVADRLVHRLNQAELSPEWYEATINDLYFEAYREMNRFQEIYDKQTKHGMDTVAQERWNRMLDEALAGNWEDVDQVLRKDKRETYLK
jgi:hypothetical protein